MAIRMRGPALNCGEVPLDLLVELNWKHFDATNFSGWANSPAFQGLMSQCDSSYIYFTVCPYEIMQYLKGWTAWGAEEYHYWFRNPGVPLAFNTAFQQSNLTFDSVVASASGEVMYYGDEDYSLKPKNEQLAEYTDSLDRLWFYEVYDEAPNQQWHHVYDDPDNDFYDNYVPNMYEYDSVGDSLILDEIVPSSIYSWQKWIAENDTLNAVEFVINVGIMHTIEMDQYEGLAGNIGTGSLDTLAVAIRAIMDAEYQPPPAGGGTPDTTFPNPPQRICFDYYPFRYVDAAYQSTTTMCDTNWVFLVDHCEEGMDSTILNAVVEGQRVPVYFYAQTMGATGGPKFHNNGQSSGIDYPSYLYRNPMPREFRMLCNLALLHQAKGILPYSLCSYIQKAYELSENDNYSCTALLDRHLIPFDAPYEEWVYTGRWPVNVQHDYSYGRPDSTPPWNDGFDPLYDLAAPPSGSYAKFEEDWYNWLFEPYGDLWEEIGGIMAGVKRIAPEMHGLWWCADTTHRHSVSMSVVNMPLQYYVPPRIRVFEDDAHTGHWAFWVNRYCRAEETAYEITVHPDSLPSSADCSDRLLDHTRRFVMDGSYDRQTGTYVFQDTLEAGGSRLAELFNPIEGLDADVRITEGDVRVLHPQRGDTVAALSTTAGNSIDILATFYNMGTESRGEVEVVLYDSTAGAQVGSPDTLRFAGLPCSTASVCRQTDSRTATFTWSTDSTDIGRHLLTVTAASWQGEPDASDNSVDMTFLVRPRDYSTTVRGDAWDMTEDAGGSPPAWRTSDIDGVSGDWIDSQTAGWTDSISGMFEGAIAYDSTADRYTGDIALSIPDDGSEYIDTDLYHMLSLGMVGLSKSISDDSLKVMIRWRDSGGTWHGWSETGLSPGTSRSGWEVLGPVDLKDVGIGWGTLLASDLELRFFHNGFGTSPPIEIDSLRVRVGWVRLEESLQ